VEASAPPWGSHSSRIASESRPGFCELCEYCDGLRVPPWEWARGHGLPEWHGDDSGERSTSRAGPAAAISCHHEIGDRQPPASIQSASRQCSTCGPLRRIRRNSAAAMVWGSGMPLSHPGAERVDRSRITQGCDSEISNNSENAPSDRISLILLILLTVPEESGGREDAPNHLPKGPA
jgi:hypothetical protein